VLLQVQVRNQLRMQVPVLFLVLVLLQGPVLLMVMVLLLVTVLLPVLELVVLDTLLWQLDILHKLVEVLCKYLLIHMSTQHLDSYFVNFHHTLYNIANQSFVVCNFSSHKMTENQ